MAKTMALLPILVIIVLTTWASSAAAQAADMVVAADVQLDGRAAIADVDSEAFICATLDWWPPEKCDYGVCSWGHASLLNLNLANPILNNAVKDSTRGTLQDNVVYHVGKKAEPCNDFVKDPSVMFGFRDGCLKMWRWNELNEFFQNVGAQVVFGLNALFGRKGPKRSNGPWDPTNARDFIQYTHDKGYEIFAWEFGNEVSGSGVGTNVDAAQYAADVSELSKIVDEIYQDPPASKKPLIIAPDGFYDRAWFPSFLKALAALNSSVDVLTHHIYNLGPGSTEPSKLVDEILNINVLNNQNETFRELRDLGQKYGPSHWVGESGGAYNSGNRYVTNTFVMGFWYIDQLGMSARFGTKVHCRQSLIGGNYGLLNTTTYAPNPDYYSALLWHRLMGSKVLDASVTNIPDLRAYAHCSKDNEGVTIVFLNLNNHTSYQISLKFSTPALLTTTMRKEYHLTPGSDYLQSQVMALNGVPLNLSSEGDVPDLLPQLVMNDDPIIIKPRTYAFISIPVNVEACPSVVHSSFLKASKHSL